MNKKIKGIIEALIVVALFLAFSYIIQSNLEFLEGMVSNNIAGIAVYLLLEIFSIVIAPVTTLPLVIIASNLWGWIVTGILNIAGWMIGSWIAFIIARRYGVSIIKKFISINDIYKIEKKIPKERLFWTLVLLRVIIPMDILSYAVGMFTQISTKKYLLATLIGITPFAFLFAYIGGIKIEYQIILFLIIGIIILIGWIIKLTCIKCSEYIKGKSIIK